MSVLNIDIKTSGVSQATKDIQRLDKETLILKESNIKLRRQMEMMPKALKNYKAKQQALTKEIKSNSLSISENTLQRSKLNKELTESTKKTKKLKGETDRLTRAEKANKITVSSLVKVVGALGIAYGLLKLKDVAVEIVKVGANFEALQASLNASVGGADKGAKSFEFLTKQADRLGISLIESIKGFKELSASAKGTALEGDKITNIFTSIAEASTVMQLSVEDTNGVFRALSQIMSKGTVQAEELRGQLGERIPGAFQIASRAMNVTTQELGKMLQKGEVISDVFLPKFAEEMKRTFGEFLPDAVNTARASFNRFNNEMALLKKGIADSGLTDFAKQFTDVGTAVLRAVGTQIDGMERGAEASNAYAVSVLNAFDSIINAFGFVGEAVNLLSIPFNLLSLSVKGILFAIVGMLEVVVKGIEGTINQAISGLNALLDVLNPTLQAISDVTGLNLTINRVSNVTFSRGFSDYANDVQIQGATSIDQDIQDLKNAFDGMGDASNLAQQFKESFANEFAKISRPSPSSQVSGATATGGSSQDNTKGEDSSFSLENQAIDVIGAIEEFSGNFGLKELKDLQDAYLDNNIIFQDVEDRMNALIRQQTKTIKATEEQTESVKKEEEVKKELNKEIKKSEEIYTTTTESINGTNHEIDKTSNSFDKLAKSAKKMTVQFTSVLFKSFEDGLRSLQNISDIGKGARGKIFGSSVTKSSFQSSLLKARSLQSQSLSSPLNAKLAGQFSNAISELNNKVSGYLDPKNFTSTSDFKFAQMNTANELEGFGESADIQANLLAEVASLIADTNQALADGIITEAETKALSATSEKILESNKVLLGNNGAVASTIVGIGGAKTLGDIVSISNAIANVTGQTKSEIISVKNATESTEAKTKANANTSRREYVQTGYQKQRIGTDRTVVGTPDNWRSWSDPIYQFAPSFGWVTGAGSDKGYAHGGFTGEGGKYEEAGTVHKGEYVLSQEMLRNVGGVGAVESFINSQNNSGSKVQSAPRGNNNSRVEMLLSSLIAQVSQNSKNSKELTRLFKLVTQGGESMKMELIG